MAPHSTLRSLVWRYLIRADRFPPQPFAHGADDEIKPLDSAQSLIMAGYRFRNCLRRHLGGVLTGAIAFAEFRDLILEFKPLSGGGWILTDVHSHRNGLVASEDEQAARGQVRELRRSAHHPVGELRRMGRSSSDHGSMGLDDLVAAGSSIRRDRSVKLSTAQGRTRQTDGWPVRSAILPPSVFNRRHNARAAVSASGRSLGHARHSVAPSGARRSSIPQSFPLIPFNPYEKVPAVVGGGASGDRTYGEGRLHLVRR